MNKVTTVGIDLAKRVFVLHGIHAAGQVRLRRMCRHEELVRRVSQLPPCLIGMGRFRVHRPGFRRAR
jgi:transposase